MAQALHSMRRMTTPWDTKRECRDGQPRLAETGLSERVGRLASISPDSVRGLVHELEAHRAEIEKQNEERRAARRGLESSRDRYADLYGLARVA